MMHAPLEAKIIELAARAAEVLEITELEPAYEGFFAGKCINLNNKISQYPRVSKWRQSVARVPATIAHLFAYLQSARLRNIVLIRGTPGNVERQPTLRRLAGLYKNEDRGDHGFYDEPTKVFPLDIDGVPIAWRADPERAVKAVVAELGEPWASTSFVWFLSATCGLACKTVIEPKPDGKDEKHKYWTGKRIDGDLRARIMFITDRALDASEAAALTEIAAERCAALGAHLDPSVCRTIQPNYIRRPMWMRHPHRDVLGKTPTIGWVRGTHDHLAVPDHLEQTARWAKAQGHGSSIADHPDAGSAVCAIGSDGQLRAHLTAAVQHLLRANPVPDVVSHIDHGYAITDALQDLINRHHETIDCNLEQHRRTWGEVDVHLGGMPDFAVWCLEHPASLHRRKTIKLSKSSRNSGHDSHPARQAISERTRRAFALAYEAALAGEASCDLIVEPPGVGKSTEIRARAVQLVTERPGETVAILVPRHRLGDEQIAMLHAEHPNANVSAAVWRGRHAWNPAVGDGRQEKMCRRSDDAEKVEMKLLNVERSLCKRGRGAKTIKCPFHDGCAFQQQKNVEANIWFAAHECAVHEKPRVFGDIGWIIFDEDMLDAIVFGLDSNKPVTLELDALKASLKIPAEKLGNCGLELARQALYRALD
jgi:hypothetical protein